MSVKRLAVYVLIGVACLLGVIAALTAFFLIWPRTDAPTNADAIVVFGGEHPERLAEGVRLAREGLAAVLVTSDPPDPDEAVCRDTAAVDVVCIDPQPPTTREEAREVSKLAARRGWRSLVLVTSTYHVTRARMLLKRCYRGRVSVVAKRADEGFVRTLDRFAHEWGGLGYALLYARGC